MTAPAGRRLHWGAEASPSGGVSFRLWAPGVDAVTLRLTGTEHAMRAGSDGWFDLDVAETSDGDDYAFVLPDGLVVPDPAAACQAMDVHGASRFVRHDAYDWQETTWRGRPFADCVYYELHVGTFTPQGTLAAAIEKLPHLAETGFTAIELMPLAQFAGSRGWGYDGVLPYCVHNAYGTPDDLRRFVDAAHGLGLMVVLDVVYNHFGPDGNYLGAYAPDFFHPEKHTPWGAAIAYEKKPVRDFFVENALFWLKEYHLDGLRLDAVDHVADDLLEEIARRVRTEFPDRHIHLTTEDNRNVVHLHERDADGSVLLHSGEWNDDYHNTVHVAATGEREGYYRDFAGDIWAKLARSLAEGYAFQGERSEHQDGPRGEPSAHLPVTAFVDFNQNHDQFGNRAFGERLIELAPEPMVEALTVLLALSPHVPLFYMGEEWGERRPFLFFTDFHGELADAVREGRRREFADFGAFGEGAASLKAIPDPNDLATFEASRIDWTRREGEEGRRWHALFKDLLAKRQAEIVPLIEGDRGHAGRVVKADAGIVAVDWRFPAATLSLRADLAATGAALPDAGGTIVHSYERDGHRVVWSVAKDGGPA